MLEKNKIIVLYYNYLINLLAAEDLITKDESIEIIKKNNNLLE